MAGIELLGQMNESLPCGVWRKSGQLNFFNLKNIDFPLLEIFFGELLFLNQDFLIPKIIFSKTISKS